MERKRILLLDEMRGAAVICMVGYHALWDLRDAGLWEGALLSHPVMAALRAGFAAFFVMTAGFSCLLSRNNWRRGGICLLAAEGVAMAAEAAGYPIRFGVLHLLGNCILLAACAWKAVESVKAPAGFFSSLVLAVLTAGIPDGRFLWFDFSEGAFGPAFYPLGIIGEGFASADYFPFFPWGLVFFAGLFAGKWIMAKGVPPFAMKSRCPFLAACGRRALFIYLLHQPVLMGLLFAAGAHSAR